MFGEKRNKKKKNGLLYGFSVQQLNKKGGLTIGIGYYCL